MTLDRPAHRRVLGWPAVALLAMLIGSMLSTGAAAATNGTTVVRGVQLA